MCAKGAVAGVEACHANVCWSLIWTNTYALGHGDQADTQYVLVQSGAGDWAMQKMCLELYPPHTGERRPATNSTLPASA